MENNKSNNKLVILLTIIIICLVVGGGFVLYKVLSDTPNSNLGGSNNNNQHLSGDENITQLKNYILDNINNVVVEFPDPNADDLVYKSATITNKEEIKNLLLNVDDAKKIGTIPSEVGYESNLTITVNYNGEPSVHIIILDNGNVAINHAVGAGENSYAEYSINNKKLATELINEYNTIANNKNGLKNYTLDNIKNVVVEFPEKNADDLVYKSATITNKEEIKNLLLNVDDAKKIGTIPSEVGYNGNVTITVNYNGDPSVHIIILDNGNVAINHAVGAGENSYAEYSINNKKLATELINEYND